MTTEEILDWYEIRDREVDELLAGVVRLVRVRNHPSLTAADAYIRFERSLSSLRELEEDMHLARVDLIIAYGRLRELFTRRRPFGSKHYVHTVKVSWTELKNSLSTYRLFASRAYTAMRAALSLIFLRE
jgi:hypothetical protein